MLLSILATFLLTLSGVAISYLFEDDEPLLWRLAAGNVLGSTLFGTISFVVALAAGLNIGTVLGSAAIALMPMVLFVTKGTTGFGHDWRKAKGKLDGANLRKFFRFLYYAGAFVLLWLFF